MPPARARAWTQGRWVGYTWKNNDAEPAYLKLAYIVRVTRGGRSYYAGVGLGDHDWRDSTVGLEGGGPSQW
jgi:hypothetical protein